METLPFRDKEKTKSEIVSENIKSLQASTDELSGLITDDKEAINNFFFNENTSEKITGLINTYSSDRELKINDNLKIFLQHRD